MNIEQRSVGDAVVLDLHGKLAAGDTVIKNTVDTLASKGVKKVVLNFADVPYMDSVGLNAIVRAHMTLSNVGGQLRLMHLSKHLADILTITRLTTIFELFDDESDAISSFSRAS